MKTIYFVRHGQSEANSLGVASGGELETLLTDNGRAQAKKTGIMLKDKKVELIVSSPMKRAVETAEIIAKEIGYSDKIVTNPMFTERMFGIYSERPDEEYMKAVLGDGPLHKSVEPVEVMHERVTKGLEWLKKLKAQKILVVSHGGVSRMLRLMHQNLPHSHMYKLERLDNASIYEFSL